MAAASSRSMPLSRQYQVRARYMAPVSRYASRRRRATSRLTLDFPDPEGPSMATTSGLPWRSMGTVSMSSCVITAVPAIHGR